MSIINLLTRRMGEDRPESGSVRNFFKRLYEYRV